MATPDRPLLRGILPVFFFLSSFAVRGQEFKGTIVDRESHEPLEAVHVQLLRSDSTLYAYTFSAADGSFHIQDTDLQTWFISFSSLGYDRLLLPVREFRYNDQIQLSAAALRIREVTVRSERIRQREDTLVYSVSGFKMEQDRSIADVIRKMPGLEVRPSGAILFQGKAISHLYIEGMNLLEGKYALATENLSAGKVKSVEVLQNHQPIRALQGKTFSDQAALNLVLREDAKAQLIGSVDAALGAATHGEGSFLYDNRILGMIFGSRQQNLSMYKNNNTGKDITREVQILTRADLLQSRVLPEESDVVWPLSFALPDINQERSLFNRTHMVATNQLWKTKSSHDVRLQLHYVQDRKEQESFTETLYTEAEEQVLLTESRDVRQKKDEFEFDLLTKINEGSFFLSNRVKGNIRLSKDGGNVWLNDAYTPLYAKPEREEFAEYFELIRRFAGNKSVSVSSQTTYTHLPQYLLIGNDGEQQVHMNAWHSHTYTYFRQRIAGLYVQYKAGIQLHSQRLNSRLTYQEREEQGKGQYQENRLYLEPGVTYRNYKFSTEGQVALSWVQMKLSDAPSGKSPSAYRFFPEPSLRMQYDLSAYSRITADYAYRYETGDLNQLYTGLIFHSYRMATRNSGTFFTQRKHRIQTSFRYNQPLKGLFFFLNLYVHPGKQALIYGREWQGDVQVRTSRNRQTATNHYGILGRASKSFAWWKSTVSLSGNYSCSDDRQLSQEELISYQLQTGNASLSLATQPCAGFTLESEHSFLYSRLKNKSFPALSSEGLRAFRHKVVLNYFPIKKVGIRWNNECYHSNDWSVSFHYFSDISCSYRLKKWELQVCGNNMWGNKNYERIYIGTLQQTYMYSRLRPAEWIVTGSFTF